MDNLGIHQDHCFRLLQECQQFQQMTTMSTLSKHIVQIQETHPIAIQGGHQLRGYYCHHHKGLVRPNRGSSGLNGSISPMTIDKYDIT